MTKVKLTDPLKLHLLTVVNGLIVAPLIESFFDALRYID